METDKIDYWAIRLQLRGVEKLYFEAVQPLLEYKYFNTVLDRIDDYLYREELNYKKKKTNG